MKTNAKRKNSAVKKLIPAAGMLALSASMLATSTYAWFTMNKTVTVTGMEVKTAVGSNLLISHDTTGNTKLNATDSFVTSDSTSIKAWLEPVSSNDGKATNFWYTLDADAAGKKIANSAAYTDYDDTSSGGLSNASDNNYANMFSQNYGVTSTAASEWGGKAVGYVDYAFQLKATNSSSSTESIYLTDLTLKYGANPDGDNAFRAAVFVEGVSNNVGENNSTYFAAGGTTSNAIYAPSGADYYTDTKAVGVAQNASEPSLQDITLTTSATPIANIGAGETKYYKVVVRLWLEGEDESCTNATFATLTNTWQLSLRLDLGAATDNGTKVNGNKIVTALTMDTTAANNSQQP